jgi:hypothetical protein
LFDRRTLKHDSTVNAFAGGDHTLRDSVCLHRQLLDGCPSGAAEDTGFSLTRQLNLRWNELDLVRFPIYH